MVAPTQRISFDSATEGASVASFFDAVGGTGTLLGKAVAALRGGKGLEVTGAGVSSFGVMNIPSTTSETIQYGFTYSGTPPGTTVDFMVLRSASANGALGRLTTAGLLLVSGASGTVFTLNGGVAIPAGNYWLTISATKGTTASNGVVTYWLHNADTNALLETNSTSTADTGTAVFTTVRYGKSSAGGTYTMRGDKPSYTDGATTLIDLPPVFGTTTDALGLTDSVTFAKLASTTDSMGLSDSVSKAIGAAVTDALGLTDADTVEVLNIDDSVTDAMGLTDSAVFALAGLTPGAVTDAMGLTDQVSFTLARSVVDAMGLTDSQAENLADSVTDTMGLTDSVAFQLQRVLVDQMGLTDAPSSTGGSPPAAYVVMGGVRKASIAYVVIAGVRKATTRSVIFAGVKHTV